MIGTEQVGFRLRPPCLSFLPWTIAKIKKSLCGISQT
nr:MAG TPA: hypothetical protein [Caudoviricetes sp.]